MRIENKRCRNKAPVAICLCLMMLMCACGSKTAEDNNTSEPREDTVQNVEIVEPVAEQNNDETTEAPDNEDNSSKVLVVYSSHTGTTKGVSFYRR